MKAAVERRLWALGLDPAADACRVGERPDWDVSEGLEGRVAERRAWLAALAQAGVLRLDARAAALDLGCGSGAATLALAERVELAIGLDVHWPHLVAAVEAARVAGAANVRFYCGTLSGLGEPALSLASCSWRLIVAYDALPRETLLALPAAAAPLLEPGGALALTYPRFWFHDGQQRTVVEERLRGYLATYEPAWQPWGRDVLVEACQQAGLQLEAPAGVPCAETSIGGYLFYATGMSLTLAQWQDTQARNRILTRVGVDVDEPLPLAWLAARRVSETADERR